MDSTQSQIAHEAACRPLIGDLVHAMAIAMSPEMQAEIASPNPQFVSCGTIECSANGDLPISDQADHEPE